MSYLNNFKWSSTNVLIWFTYYFLFTYLTMPWHLWNYFFIVNQVVPVTFLKKDHFEINSVSFLIWILLESTFLLNRDLRRSEIIIFLLFDRSNYCWIFSHINFLKSMRNVTDLLILIWFPTFISVCTTELGRVQKLVPEFKKRGFKLAALSCDDVESHKG